MWQAHHHDDEASEHARFVLTGSRGLGKDSLKRCLTDFAPKARVVDVEHITEAAQAPPTAHLMLFDADDAHRVLPRDINLVRDQHRGIRIVAIGNNDPLRPCHLMLSSIDGFIPRSTRLADFYQALHHVLDGGTYFPSAYDSRPADKDACRQMLAGEYDNDRDDLATLLTRRQREVLGLLAVGDSNKQIAQKLGIAEKTVKIHVASVCSQLGVDNRTKAAIIGLTLPNLVDQVRDHKSSQL